MSVAPLLTFALMKTVKELKLKPAKLRTRIQVSITLIVIAVFIVMIFFQSKSISGNTENNTSTRKEISFADTDTRLTHLSLTEYKYTRPLLLADIAQDKTLQPLKDEIERYIQQKTQRNIISRASVYVIKLNSDSWMALNENELYNPASMAKLFYLITYLKAAEARPSLLKETIYFGNHFSQGNSQTIGDFHLQENRNYTVNELLKYMIEYSDNDAAGLLMLYVNKEIYKKLFSDLALPAPPETGEYFISITDYAKLFRVLYNATYLGKDYSEYAMELLTASEYRDGICSVLDSSIVVAHKFGERIINGVAQLHECGIVFYRNEPYLLGIMTKGDNLQPLKTVLPEISGIVFNYMREKTN